MIDPFTAVAAATTAFNTVKKFVHAGQEFENVMGQMGKWYTSVSDFRKGQQLQKKPPIFRKLLQIQYFPLQNGFKLKEFVEFNALGI